MTKSCSFTCFTACVAMAASLSLQAADVKTLRKMTDEDRASLRQVTSAQVTPDGRWFVYCVAAESKGEAFVVLHNLRNGSERRLSAGAVSLGGGHLKLSNSGRWAAFLMAAKSTVDQEPNLTTAVIVEVASGRKHEFPNVRDFSFIGESTERLLLENFLVKTARPASEPPTFDLSIHELSTGKTETLHGVSSYAVNSNGTRLAWVNAQGLQLSELLSGVTRVLDQSTASTYQKLTWSERGSALAVFRNTTGADRAILAYTGLGEGEPRKTVYIPRGWSGFPDGYEINVDDTLSYENQGTTAALLWRQDEKGLFFGIRALPVERSPGASQPTTVPNLVLWNWQDPQLPPEKEVRKRFPVIDLCFVSLDDGRFVRLADAALRQVMPHATGRYILGYDLRSYGWRNPSIFLRASQARDYYVVDLYTGQRRNILKGLRVVTLNELSVQPQLSPDASTLLYQDNGDYFAYDVASGRRRNLTADLPTKFYLEENPPQNQRQVRSLDIFEFALQGWSEDGEYVFVTDHHDVWALPLHDGHALNLTENGRRDGIQYQLMSAEGSRLVRSTGAARIDLAKPVYFSMTEWRTDRQGLAKRLAGQEKLERWPWEAAGVNYHKAANADIYLYYRVTIAEGGDYYLLDSSRRPIRRLTQTNPQLREFQRSPGAKLLTYTTTHGDTMHGVLHLPAGYVAGRACPTIVYIYERMNTSPFFQGVSTIKPFLQQGYAVLLADIQPRINAAGPAAVEGVTAAVNAAVATGITDRNRLGLYGHSYGGYETVFIVTQTDLFKAAVPYAAIFDLWSHYGAVDYTNGTPLSVTSESDQPFLAGPWWENREAFLQNSPLQHALKIKTPLLLVHGDKDSTVPFLQAVEFFNTLRRMGDKPVVLLQYVGEDHELDWGDGVAERDFQQRMMQFFDHFLKGAPAPAWWLDGFSYYQGRAPTPQ